MKLYRPLLSCMSLLAGASLMPAAQAAVVDFDDPSVTPLVFVGLGTADIQGLTFSYPGDPGYAIVWDGSSPNANGTNNFILGYSPSVPVIITRTGGGPFDLDSIDLAISWYSSATIASILINGSPLIITDVLTTYTLDLTNVSSVTITGLDTGDGYWSADNFVYSAAGAVPEPATWAMTLLGAGLVGGALRGRRRVSVAYA